MILHGAKLQKITRKWSTLIPKCKNISEKI